MRWRGWLCVSLSLSHLKRPARASRSAGTGVTAARTCLESRSPPSGMRGYWSHFRLTPAEDSTWNATWCLSSVLRMDNNTCSLMDLRRNRSVQRRKNHQLCGMDWPRWEYFAPEGSTRVLTPSFNNWIVYLCFLYFVEYWGRNRVSYFKSTWPNLISSTHLNGNILISLEPHSLVVGIFIDLRSTHKKKETEFNSPEPR